VMPPDDRGLVQPMCQEVVDSRGHRIPLELLDIRGQGPFRRSRRRAESDVRASELDVGTTPGHLCEVGVACFHDAAAAHW